MNNKILCITIMACLLATSAYGVNYKRLKLEADTYQHRIWARVPSEEQMIKRSLSFLTEKEEFDPKYTQAERFLQFYQDTTEEIKNEYFMQFATICKKIYEEGKFKDRISIYMLFEEVKKMSLKHLALLRKLKRCKQQEDTQVREIDAEKMLDYFLNIDQVDRNLKAKTFP
ncbi:MAG: hypothetical protein K2W92_07280 [Alphaproteobacteria bacterium]|nr:hypothetical protein [Alphaproteobacteria bacterium]